MLIKLCMRLLCCCMLCGTANCAWAQSVVLNKYYVGPSNPQQDVVELLVVQAGTDLRGMVIKDFSGSMGTDAGGKYTFANHSLWQSVAAGTLVVIRNNATTLDVNSSDYVLDVALGDANYFTYQGGTWDLSSTDMVMLKQAGSDVLGVAGAVHTLAAGTASSLFTAAPNPKLLATNTTSPGTYCFANNSNSTLGDYTGNDATGNATGLSFGVGNNASNTQYILQLRGLSITTSVDSLQLGAVQVGSQTTRSYQVTGTALTNSIRVSSPSVLFTLSNNGINYADTAMLASTGGTIFVRYAPTAAGSHQALLLHSSSGISRQLLVRGAGSAQPQPSISFADPQLDFGQVALGTQPQLSVAVQGSNLSEAITVSSNDTTLALSTNQLNWQASVQLPAAGATLWLRFSPSAQQNYNITVTASSTGQQQQLSVLGQGVWNADLQPVVINKMLNASVDAVELLVLRSQTNLQGLILKDFSDNMQGDAGGKYRFANHPMWQNLRAGTLIILRANSSVADTDPSDWVLDVGLQNGNYFINLDPGSVFDIAGHELVMLKSSSAPFAGSTGCVHALAGGTTGSFWAAAAQPKLLAANGLGIGQFVAATTPNSQLNEFAGTAAMGAQSGLTLGLGNSPSNQVLINALRGTTANDVALAIKLVPRCYPNPVNDVLYVQPQNGQTLVKAVLHDIVGNAHHLVLLSSLNNAYELSLRHLPPGLYALQLITRGGDSHTVPVLIAR